MSDTQPQPISEVLKSKVQPESKELQAMGIEVGKLYTNMGFPIDMALARLNMTKEQKLSVLDGACRWLIEHKRNSGATDKAIERQRQTNKRMVERFIEKGEVDVY